MYLPRVTPLHLGPWGQLEGILSVNLKFHLIKTFNRALVRILRSVGADFRFLNSLVSFINKDIEFLIKSVGAKAPFQKSVGAAAPTAHTLTRALHTEGNWEAVYGLHNNPAMAYLASFL